MEVDHIKGEKYDSEEDIVIVHTDIPQPREDSGKTSNNEPANIFDRLNDIQAAMNRDDIINDETTGQNSESECDIKNTVESTAEMGMDNTRECNGDHRESMETDNDILPPVLEPEDDVMINDVSLKSTPLDSEINCKAEIVTESDGNKIYKCLTCNQTFNYYSNIARHRLRHTRQTNSLHKCWYCDHAFQKQLNLREHVRRAHDRLDVYECSACLRRFRYKGYLASHAFNCTGKFPYECLFCSQKLGTYSDLTKHSFNHYACMFCDNKYNDLYSLENHEKSHAVEEFKHQSTINTKEVEKNLIENLKPLLQPVIKEYRSIAKPSQHSSNEENVLPECVTDDWITGLSATDSYRRKTIARIKARSRQFSNRPNLQPLKTTTIETNNHPSTIIPINKSPSSTAINNAILLPNVRNSNSATINNPNNVSSSTELSFLLITTDLSSGHILLQPLELIAPKNSHNELQTQDTPNVVSLTNSATMQENFALTNKSPKSLAKGKIIENNKTYSRPWNMTNILNVKILTQVIKPNGDLVYACHSCLREFKKIDELKKHDCGISKRTTCKFCGIQISRVSLMGHENRHLGVRHFKCDICHRGFTTDQILKRHIKDVHNSGYSYCAFCKAIFARAANLENHLVECTQRNTLVTGTILEQQNANTIDLTDD